MNKQRRERSTLYPKILFGFTSAGFFEKRLLEYLESQQLPYIIVARLTAVVRKFVIHPGFRSGKVTL